MGRVIPISDFRTAKKVTPPHATLADSVPAYYCMRCDTDRFMLYPSGLVRCVNCGAVMGNIRVSISRRFKQGQEQ